MMLEVVDVVDVGVVGVKLGMVLKTVSRVVMMGAEK